MPLSLDTNSCLAWSPIFDVVAPACMQIHYCKKGQEFRAQAQSLHIETLKSPWLCELLAFYINLRQKEPNTRTILGIFGDCALTFDDGKPELSCGLFDSVKLEIDLTCSICLVSLLFCCHQISLPLRISCVHYTNINFHSVLSIFEPLVLSCVDIEHDLYLKCLRKSEYYIYAC